MSAALCCAADTIVFKNGDVLSGEILQRTPTKVYFKSPAFGSVALSMRDISEIRPPQATPQPAPEPAPSTAAAPKAEKPQPKAKPSKKRAKSKWSGQTGLALAWRERSNLDANGNKKNTDEFETYRLYGHLKWKGRKNDFKWSWNYKYSETDDVVKDDFLNLTQDYRHSFTPRYYATGKTMYQRDPNRKISKEHLQSAEFGFQWFNTSKFKLSTSGGMAFHRYDRSRGEITENEAKFIFDESFRWQMINSLTLFQKYTHLGDLENYNMSFSGGVENKLIRDLFVRVEYRMKRDTEVNYESRSYYDTTLNTSLLYKF